jgi:23S rRNA pseudouridine1911/1915/1917 synthase
MLSTEQSAPDYDDEPEASEAQGGGVPSRLAVAAAHNGLRVDKALAQLLPAVSRSRIRQWIEAGAVRLNDRAPQPRAIVSEGDVIELAPPPAPEAGAFEPEPIPLDIVFADASILVVDKPAGLVVHPGAGNWSGTLLNGLLAYDARLRDLPRAGIVHRLDADTSGLMVVARTIPAHTELVRQLQARTVTREYWALVYGTAPAAGVIEAPIARDPRHPLRFRAGPGARARPARTLFRRAGLVQAGARTLSWLVCRLETGRTHQIRVHLESIGLPLVGDPLYLRGRPPARATDDPHGWTRFPRQALHACMLALVHPRSGRARRWFRPPPADMATLMAQLGFDPLRPAPVFE